MEHDLDWKLYGLSYIVGKRQCGSATRFSQTLLCSISKLIMYMEEKSMDGQNFGNGQNNNYQDNTANVPYQSTYSYEDNNSGKANGLQIASLVLGIISIVLICCYGAPSVILGLIGLILAIMGNKRSKHGIGIAGLVCSIIGLCGGIISLVYYIWILSSAEFWDLFNMYYNI